MALKLRLADGESLAISIRYADEVRGGNGTPQVRVTVALSSEPGLRCLYLPSSCAEQLEAGGALRFTARDGNAYFKFPADRRAWVAARRLVPGFGLRHSLVPAPSLFAGGPTPVYSASPPQFTRAAATS